MEAASAAGGFSGLIAARVTGQQKSGVTARPQVADHLHPPTTDPTEGADPVRRVEKLDVPRASRPIPLQNALLQVERVREQGSGPIAAVGEHRINDRIRVREVRLVSPDGQQLGIKPVPEALAIARDLDLDLVEVAPTANPPVCRIMDYGKFKFDEAQKAKESRRKSVNVGVKEMKYRPKIGPGDFDTKTRQVAKFLDEGHKVKLTIMFRGREVFHPELGKKILDAVAERIGDGAKIEAEPRLDGRNMTMVLAPQKRSKPHEAKPERPAASEPRAEQEAPAPPAAEESTTGEE
jgi:translation initiation factor IF-3